MTYECDLGDDSSFLEKWLENEELDAPIVTLPITTAPVVFGLNCGMETPSGAKTFTNLKSRKDDDVESQDRLELMS